ncbi:MAG: Fis family transcriptional regulator [Gammaproteobacteria bacterium]|nr:MAG: Fis family transcriptional regulator [Gammaproteobacteria bacterium]
MVALHPSTAEPSATVIAVDGEEATIRIDQTGCGRCHESGGCAGHHLGRLLCAAPRTYRVANPERCVVGQSVRVDVGAGVLAKSAVCVYVIPLCLLLAAAVGGSLLVGEAGAITGALGGLLTGWLGLRQVHRRRPPDPRYRVSIRS